MAVLSEVAVDIVAAADEARFRDLMQAHHYLGAVPGMGETVRYVVHHRGRWLALPVFSAPALKCGARDRWIGWEYGVQFGRLHLVTNNARFLLLPGRPPRGMRRCPGPGIVPPGAGPAIPLAVRPRRELPLMGRSHERVVVSGA